VGPASMAHTTSEQQHTSPGYFARPTEEEHLNADWYVASPQKRPLTIDLTMLRHCRSSGCSNWAL
jgi:hypothetical protein